MAGIFSALTRIGSGVLKTVTRAGTPAKVAKNAAETAAKNAANAARAAETVAETVRNTGKVTARQARVIEAAAAAQKEANAAVEAATAASKTKVTSQIAQTLTSKTVLGTTLLGGSALAISKILSGDGTTPQAAPDDAPKDTTPTGGQENPYAPGGGGTSGDDFDWQAWYDSLFGGADEAASGALDTISDVPILGDIAKEAQEQGLSIPLIIVAVLAIVAGVYYFFVYRKGSGKTTKKSSEGAKA
ncbi:hypothetical protein [Methanofollis ethanolicus]|uniref:hypothetical protein n=1 Tax=Methanofollis ethanolicus TaxID=488124 RepID=UPI0008325A6C|nr:hypothetical protein [Methanofollis ethanolicus]